MENSKIQNRLKRVEGQVRGVQKMVDEGREFPELVTQLQAIKSALSSLIMILIEEKFSVSEQGLSITPDDAALMLRLLRD